MMMLALIAAAVAPLPSEVRTFQDWTVACDNGRRCEAVALLPDGVWEGFTTLLLRRGGGPGDAPELILDNLEQSPAALLLDGRALPVGFVADESGYRLEGDRSVLIDALRRGQRLEARDAGGTVLGRVSLAGAAAALLYMDERQHRIGTVTALVRPGRRPASAVPPPPVLPEVRIAPAPSDPPIDVDASTLAQLRRRHECTEFDVREDEAFTSAQIATGTTLVLIPCGSGAYNFSSLPVVVTQAGDRLETRVAPFDSQWGLAAEGHPLLVNADWDVETLRLREFNRGRGLGDCGTRSEYVWDGERFRLVHQEEMQECRGSLSYVTTWRAETVDR